MGDVPAGPMGWQPELDELRHREALAERLGGPERVRRQHDGGRLAIRERVEKLVAPGTFHELGKIAGMAVCDEANGLRLPLIRLVERAAGGGSVETTGRADAHGAVTESPILGRWPPQEAMPERPRGIAAEPRFRSVSTPPSPTRTWNARMASLGRRIALVGGIHSTYYG